MHPIVRYAMRRARPAVVLFAFIVLGFAAAVAHAADVTDGGFTLCANEGAYCAAGTGERQARFGVGQLWVQKAVAAQSFACDSNIFGDDPAVGQVKACYVADGAPPDSDSAPSINWSNDSHLMQALMVTACAFALMFGYRSGDKL